MGRISPACGSNGGHIYVGAEIVKTGRSTFQSGAYPPTRSLQSLSRVPGCVISSSHVFQLLTVLPAGTTASPPRVLTKALCPVSPKFTLSSVRLPQGPMPQPEEPTPPQSITHGSLKNAATPTVSTSLSES